MALLIVWAVSALYVWHYLPHGWVPHDEGTLAQSAQRVLSGQLPHRDFTEVYTGGLSYLDAAAFHWLGTNLLALRLVLFAVFLLWVPAVYYLATRLTSPLAAVPVVALAVAWSVPNYSAAMPSWYNLFLATFGVAAFFRHLETGRAKWLLVAGVCGGLSFLVKSIGLYYVAAVLLFCVYHEQCVARARTRDHATAGTRWYSLFVTGALLCFVAVVVALVRHRMGIPEFVHFIVPSGALVVLLLWREWTTATGEDRDRVRVLLRTTLPFLLGVCIPIALFLAPYVHTGSVRAFLAGVFITPQKRLEFADMRPPGGLRLLVALPTIVCLGFIPSWRPKLHPGVIVGVLLAACAMVLSTDWHVYQLIWNSMRVLGPLIVLVGVWLLAREEDRLQPSRQQQLALLLSVTAVCSLVQFPFAAPVYFFYVAPLVVLAGLAIVTLQPRMSRLAPAAALGFYLLFAVLRIHPGFIYTMGMMYAPDDQTVRLTGDRGGILVSQTDDRMYTELASVLRQHTSGHYTYAAPDCPEVYFLAGLRNPTRAIFDFFDDSAGRTTRVLSAIAAHHVTAVVLNERPSFSGPMPRSLSDALAARYPQHERIGHFVVRWQE